MSTARFVPLFLVALATCASPPVSRPPVPPAPPAATPTPPAPTPCERARVLRDRARADLDAGHVLRAARTVERAAATCPGDAREGWEIAWRAALALGDTAAAENIKQKILAAPDTPEPLRARVSAGEPLYLGDAPAASSASKDERTDYRRAARAWLDHRHDEAGRLAMSVALAHDKLAGEAFALAAAAARDAGDVARAHRMEARAFRARCPDGCGADAVEPPQEGLFAAVLRHPELVPWFPPCVDGTANFSDAKPDAAVTPDGRFHVSTTDTSMRLRAIPSRALVSYVGLGTHRWSYTGCFASGASSQLLYFHGSGSLLRLESSDGEVTDVRIPRLTGIQPKSWKVLVSVGGSALLPDYFDDGPPPDWYFVRPKARMATRVARSPRPVFLALRSDGDPIGYEDGMSYRPRPLVQFDRASGKVRERFGSTNVDGRHCMVSPDDRRLLCAVDWSLAVADIQSGATRKFDKVGWLIGMLGPSRVLFANDDYGKDEHTILDIDTGAREPAPRIVARTFERATVALSGPHALVRYSKAIVAIDLLRGKVARFEGAFPGGEAALSDDGRWLAVGGEGEVALYDVRDPRAPERVWRKELPPPGANPAQNPSGRALSFRPESPLLVVRDPSPPFDVKVAYDAAARAEVPWRHERPPGVAERPKPACAVRLALHRTGQGGTAVYQCGATIYQDGRDPLSAPDVLAEISPTKEFVGFRDWEQRTGLFVGMHGDAIVLARATPDRKMRRIKLWLADGEAGAFAQSDDGRYALVGDAKLLGQAASCAGGMPLGVCADRWEDPDLLPSFLRGDGSEP